MKHPTNYKTYEIGDWVESSWFGLQGKKGVVVDISPNADGQPCYWVSFPQHPEVLADANDSTHKEINGLKAIHLHPVNIAKRVEPPVGYCPACEKRFINKPDYLCHECRWGNG